MKNSEISRGADTNIAGVQIEISKDNIAVEK